MLRYFDFGVFIGEVVGELDFEIDLFDHTGKGIAVHALHDLDAIG